MVHQAVQLYNTRRPHTALGYRTPQAVHSHATMALPVACRLADSLSHPCRARRWQNRKPQKKKPNTLTNYFQDLTLSGDDKIIWQYYSSSPFKIYCLPLLQGQFHSFAAITDLHRPAAADVPDGGGGEFSTIPFYAQLIPPPRP